MEKDKYADIILDQEKGYVIDHKNEIMNSYENDEKYLKENFKDFVFVTKKDNCFKAQALKYVNKVVDYAEYTGYFSYWPIYNNMNHDQSQWYFYWRHQFIKGNYLATDVSYLYLYIFELLSGVGWETPAKGLSLLESIWEHYNDIHAHLSNNLPDWIYDFMKLHNLYHPVSLFRFAKSRQVYNAYLGEVIRSEFHDLTSHDMFRVAGYRIKSIEQNNSADTALLRSFVAVNECFVQSHGTNLFDFFAGDSAVCEKKYAYVNAVKDDVVSYNIEYKNYSTNEMLREFLICMIKNFNNIYNKLLGIRGLVRTNQLDISHMLAIERALREYLQERNYRKISLDDNFLEKIKRESLELHNLLALNGDDDANEVDLIAEKEDNTLPNQNDQTEEKNQLVDKQPEDKQPEDKQHKLSDLQIRALKIIAKNNDPVTELKRLAEDNNLMMEVIINSINEYYLEDLGDIIIDIVNMKPYIIQEYLVLINNLLEE